MIFLLSNEKLIREFQFEFNLWHQNLQLEFYSKELLPSSLPEKKCLDTATSLKSAGIKCPGIFVINEDTTIGELEKILLNKFGLVACVFRKYGESWIETTRTKHLSLKTQNSAGNPFSISGPDNAVFFPELQAI